jgi:RNA polymerase sigma-70 factor (sigma-E family)
VSRDDAAFAAFFESSWDPCLRAVAASTGDMAQAEDQTAEAFARAWASWHRVSGHPAPRAWVVRTALNAGASWWRRRSKDTAPSRDDIAAMESDGTGLDDELLTALRRLPIRQREVIVLRVFLDLDIETTAMQLGVAQGTVRAHQSRAMAALRDELAPASASPREQTTTPEETKR